MSAAEFQGKEIKAAFSSLTTFSCEFMDGSGLIVEAAAGDAPKISLRLISASELPREMDAVCKVDWGWIERSKIAEAIVSDAALKLQLDKAGPLTISVQLWQGKPFLSFQPFRPAAASKT